MPSLMELSHNCHLLFQVDCLEYSIYECLVAYHYSPSRQSALRQMLRLAKLCMRPSIPCIPPEENDNT